MSSFKLSRSKSPRCLNRSKQRDEQSEEDLEEQKWNKTRAEQRLQSLPPRPLVLFFKKGDLHLLAFPVMKETSSKEERGGVSKTLGVTKTMF